MSGLPDLLASRAWQYWGDNPHGQPTIIDHRGSVHALAYIIVIGQQTAACIAQSAAAAVPLAAV